MGTIHINDVVGCLRERANETGRVWIDAEMRTTLDALQINARELEECLTLLVARRHLTRINQNLFRLQTSSVPFGKKWIGRR
jgi:hypothetical protein